MRKVIALLFVCSCNTAPAATESVPAVTVQPVASTVPACPPESERRLEELRIERKGASAEFTALNKMQDEDASEAEKAELASKIGDARGREKQFSEEITSILKREPSCASCTQADQTRTDELFAKATKLNTEAKAIGAANAAGEHKGKTKEEKTEILARLSELVGAGNVVGEEIRQMLDRGCTRPSH